MSKFLRDDIDKFYDYDLHPGTRTVYMGSVADDEEGETGTDYQMAERVIKALHILDAQADREITVIMNNLGGCWYHGMAIFDAIKSCRSHVTIRGTGHVMSMGSIILQAADKRVITPNSRVMIHFGTDGYAGHSKIFKQWASEAERVNREMEDIYLARIQAKHPEFTRAKLQKMLNFDSILTAKEAVELGLADEVCE